MNFHYERKKAERLEYQKAYYEGRKESVLIKKRTYVLENRGKILVRNRAYYLAHKEEFFAAARNREALKRGSPNKLTAGQWEEILEVFDHRCAYCLRQGLMQQDHVIALSCGGTHTAENVVPACPGCNREKWDKPVFFMAEAA